jgi:UDP-GlcNAc:undecaprenyl-phosphate GlcNAc-1-phosphate transferase
MTILHPLQALALLSAAGTFLLCYCFIRLQGVHGIDARTDKRRHHERPIPLLGGVAMGLCFFFGAAGLTTLESPAPAPGNLPLAYAAIALTLALGLADDAFELRARWKFLGQNLVALLLVQSINGIETPPDRLLAPHSEIAFVLKWFWCLGLLNSMNLIDGLDGLASGIAMIVLAFVTLAGTADSAFLLPLKFLALPVTIGFFLWNRFPARIYLGESGAQLVAIFLFLGSMTFRYSRSSGIDSVALFFALGVPILDTLLAIMRRTRRGVGLMASDREHLHHRLGRLGLKHESIVRFLHFLTLYLCAVGLAFLQLSKLTVPTLVLALTGLGINLFLLAFAERKLYSYLAHFSSHMLGVLDFSVQESRSLHLRLQEFRQTGTAHLIFRIDLSHCVSSLLESSPERIQSFYGKLSRAVRGPRGLREVQFESSRALLVLQGMNTPVSAEEFEKKLHTDLARFEQEEKIDLGLNLAHSISLVHLESTDRTWNSSKAA